MRNFILVGCSLAIDFDMIAIGQLFGTARLTNRVAEDGELPTALDHKNAAGIPDRAVIFSGAAAAVLATVGTLTSLVEAASLSFLFTFTVVCGLAFRQRAGLWVITGFAALAGATASVALIVRLISTDPLALTLRSVARVSWKSVPCVSPASASTACPQCC